MNVFHSQAHVGLPMDYTVLVGHDFVVGVMFPIKMKGRSKRGAFLMPLKP